MASTVTLAGDYLKSMGDRRLTAGTLNLGTYAANGIAVSAAQVGLGRLDELIVMPASGYVFEFDKANGKVKAYCRGALDGNAAAAAALSEVGTVDLAAVEARFIAIGY